MLARASAVPLDVGSLVWWTNGSFLISVLNVEQGGVTDSLERQACLFCSAVLPDFPEDSQRVRAYRKYCESCTTELINALWGDERTPLLFAERWLDETAARCWLCGDDEAVEDLGVAGLGDTTTGERRIWSLICRSCASTEQGPIEAGPVQEQRCLAQHEADKARYEALKPHIEDGFKQLVIYEYFKWQDNDPVLETTASRITGWVVAYLKEAQETYRRNEIDGTRYDTVGPDFDDLVLFWTTVILDDLAEQSWFEAVPENEIPTIVALELGDCGLDPRGLLPENYWPEPSVDGASEFFDSDEEREEYEEALRAIGMGWLVTKTGMPEYVFLQPSPGTEEFSDVALMTSVDEVLVVVMLEEGESESEVGSRSVEVAPGVTKRLDDCTLRDIQNANELTEAREDEG